VAASSPGRGKEGRGPERTSLQREKKQKRGKKRETFFFDRGTGALKNIDRDVGGKALVGRGSQGGAEREVLKESIRKRLRLIAKPSR